jgi:hypothetical protein
MKNWAENFINALKRHFLNDFLIQKVLGAGLS